MAKKKTVSKFIRVKNICHLARLSLTGRYFFIQLNYGIRSSKFITFNVDKNVFEIFNDIDGTDSVYTRKELNDESLSNIGKAIKLGAFWTEKYKPGRPFK